MAASSSLPLIGVQPMGARFDLGPDTKLAGSMAECVSYLRNEATNLLKTDNFSRHERSHSDRALNRIKNLYGLLRAAIMQQVRADLQTISDLSPACLVAVAATVSEAAKQDVSEAAKQDVSEA